MLFDCVTFLYGENCHIRVVTVEFAFDGLGENYNPEPDEALARQIIKKRYQAESEMLKAVSAGDAGKALCCIADLQNITAKDELPGNDLRKGKNFCIVLSVLLRKAVENGFVHPAHIHLVSADFLQRIENMASIYDLKRLVEVMIRRHCSLVNEFSLRDYSPFIRDIINHVDFNLKEPLTVASLAKQFKVSPGNLSAQFRREKGMPLTDYINVKRLERAKSMLCGTGLYIKEIAEQCGFMDDNYFSRLFTRQFGVSPGGFRRKYVELKNL
jgi:AraC-like DNA-binding protein